MKAKAPKLTKRQKAFAAVDRAKMYPLAEAVALVKKNATCKKLAESIEVAVNLGVDPKHADQQVRGMVSLRHGTGKSLKVAVFAKDAKAEEAKKAGADIVGAEDLIEMINNGKVDFDRCIATPDLMPLIGRVAKVLGPKGLMPNPKLGTVTVDVAKAVKDAKGGSIEFRVEKAGIVHAGVGKANFSEQQILENVSDLLAALNKAKPAGAKGTYVKRVTLSSTMGPGVKVDVATLAA